MLHKDSLIKHRHNHATVTSTLLPCTLALHISILHTLYNSILMEQLTCVDKIPLRSK